MSAMDVDKKIIFKERFYEKLDNLIDKNSKNTYYFSKSKTEEIINKVKECKNSDYKKQPSDYYLLQHYDVLSSNGVEKLILPLSDKNPDIKYYCSVEDLFDKLYEAHINIGHGGRDRMIKELKRQYKNIKQKEINLFLNLCEVCQKKKGA